MLKIFLFSSVYGNLSNITIDHLSLVSSAYCFSLFKHGYYSYLWITIGNLIVDFADSCKTMMFCKGINK